MAKFVAEISANINDFVSKLNEAQGKAEKFASGLKTIGGGLSIALTAPLTALAGASLKAFANVESLKNGLTALTGSASRASAQFNSLKNLSNEVGISLEDATKASINLQTIGFSAQKAESAIRGISNAASLLGKGQDDINGALYGLQQLANTEFPLGEDLNILKERLPQVSVLLKQAFGSARSEDLQKMKITSAQVVDTILTGLDKLPKATKGLNGAFENLRNGVSNALADLGETINETFDITGIVKDLTKWINDLVKSFGALSPTTRKTIVVVAALAAAIPPLLLALGSIITMAPLVGTAFTFMTGPIGIAITVIGMATILIVTNLDKIRKAISNTLQSVANFAEKIGLSGIAGKLKGAADWVKPTVKSFAESNKEYAQLADEATKKTDNLTNSTKNLNSEKSKNTKTQADYRKELIETLASMGYYDAAIQSISNRYKELNKLAKQAGASAIEVGRIAREELGEKLSLALGQISGVKPSELSRVKITPNIDFDIDSLTENLKKQQAKIKTPVIDFFKKLNEDISETLRNGMVNGISDMMASLGEALATGTNVLGSIGKSLLSTLAGLAQQVGAQLIAFGVAGLALKKLVVNPIAAIAAGAALVALGSFASASINKSINSSTSGAGGYSGNSVSSSSNAMPNYFQGAYSNNNTVVFEIEGDKLKGVLDRTDRKNRRTR